MCHAYTGTLVRPVPSSDPLAIMAAFNWQSQGLNWQSSLADCSSALPVRTALPGCLPLSKTSLLSRYSLLCVWAGVAPPTAACLHMQHCCRPARRHWLLAAEHC